MKRANTHSFEYVCVIRYHYNDFTSRSLPKPNIIERVVRWLNTSYTHLINVNHWCVLHIVFNVGSTYTAGFAVVTCVHPASSCGSCSRVRRIAMDPTLNGYGTVQASICGASTCAIFEIPPAWTFPVAVAITPWINMCNAYKWIWCVCYRGLIDIIHGNN